MVWNWVTISPVNSLLSSSLSWGKRGWLMCSAQACNLTWKGIRFKSSDGLFGLRWKLRPCFRFASRGTPRISETSSSLFLFLCLPSFSAFRFSKAWNLTRNFQKSLNSWDPSFTKSSSRKNILVNFLLCLSKLKLCLKQKCVRTQNYMKFKPIERSNLDFSFVSSSSEEKCLFFRLSRLLDRDLDLFLRFSL